MQIFSVSFFFGQANNLLFIGVLVGVLVFIFALILGGGSRRSWRSGSWWWASWESWWSREGGSASWGLVSGNGVFLVIVETLLLVIVEALEI